MASLQAHASNLSLGLGATAGHLNSGFSSTAMPSTSSMQSINGGGGGCLVGSRLSDIGVYEFDDCGAPPLGDHSPLFGPPGVRRPSPGMEMRHSPVGFTFDPPATEGAHAQGNTSLPFPSSSLVSPSHHNHLPTPYSHQSQCSPGRLRGGEQGGEGEDQQTLEGGGGLSTPYRTPAPTTPGSELTHSSTPIVQTLGSMSSLTGHADTPEPTDEAVRRYLEFSDVKIPRFRD